jgi:hypothetical protein
MTTIRTAITAHNLKLVFNDASSKHALLNVHSMSALGADQIGEFHPLDFNNNDGIAIKVEGGLIVAYMGRNGTVFADCNSNVPKYVFESVLTRIELHAMVLDMTDPDRPNGDIEKKFGALYDSLEDSVIEFNPAWKNGTGYFDGAVRADFGLAPGKMARSYCPDSQRRIIVIGTPKGNMVMFERYSSSVIDRQSFVIVYNTNRTVEDELVERVNALYERFGRMGTTWSNYHGIVGFADMLNIGESVALTEADKV